MMLQVVLMRHRSKRSSFGILRFLLILVFIIWFYDRFWCLSTIIIIILLMYAFNFPAFLEKTT